MRERTKLIHMKGETNMTVSTLSAGFLIVVVTVALELLDKDNKKQNEEFLNFK